MFPFQAIADFFVGKPRILLGGIGQLFACCGKFKRSHWVDGIGNVYGCTNGGKLSVSFQGSLLVNLANVYTRGIVLATQ